MLAIAAKPRTALVIGCGRFGAHLASALSESGADVVVVDHDEAAFARLAPDYSGFRRLADARELGALLSLAEQAGPLQRLVAATGDDATNLACGLLGRERLAIPHVCVRLADPDGRAVASMLGLMSVAPLQLAVAQLLDVWKVYA